MAKQDSSLSKREARRRRAYQIALTVISVLLILSWVLTLILK
jgi:predicted nucleic acid-binding Zn ribbon protein